MICIICGEDICLSDELAAEVDDPENYMCLICEEEEDYFEGEWQ